MSNVKEKKTDVWMPFYIRDYLADTGHLSATQHGAYLLLLATYWIRQGPLPDDDVFLANTARMTLKEWSKNRPTLAAFFTVADGHWMQKRAEKEIIRALEISDNKVKAAKIAAKARWGSPRFGRRTADAPQTHASRIPDAMPSDSVTHASRIPDAMPEQCVGNASVMHLHNHSHNHSKDDSSPTSSQCTTSGNVVVESSDSPSLSSELLSQVEQVWAIWPKRIDVMAAKLAVKDAIRRHGLEAVLEGTRRIVAAEAETRSVPPGRFLPKPVEFFEGSRYLDDATQYGPRDATQNPGALRQTIDDLVKQIAEHPGNPSNTEGSLERKEKSRGEFIELKRRLAAAKHALATLQNAPA